MAVAAAAAISQHYRATEAAAVTLSAILHPRLHHKQVNAKFAIHICSAVGFVRMLLCKIQLKLSILPWLKPNAKL